MGRRYAKTTAVPISKSRQEIDQTLRRWGATVAQIVLPQMAKMTTGLKASRLLKGRG